MILLLLIAGFNPQNSTVEKEIFIIECFLQKVQCCRLTVYVTSRYSFFGYSGRKVGRDAGRLLQRLIYRLR